MAELTDQNPLGAEIVECPHGYNAQMRAEAPVHFDPHNQVWLVTGYDLVTAILKDTDRFSSRFAAELRPWESFPKKAREILADGFPAVDTLLTTDPPDHAKGRALVARAFSHKRVQAMLPFMHETVERLLEELLPRGEMEFRDEFAQVVPLMITAQQFRVPEEDIPQLKRWSDIFAAQLGHAPKSEEDIIAEVREVVAFQHYFADKIREVQAAPGDEIISVIAKALREDDSLSMAEAIEIITQTFVAGHETTTSAMTSGMDLLLQHPDQLAALQADPELIPNFCEEVLRYESPTNNMWRITRADVELAGRHIPQGSMILLRFGGANRDEAHFGADAERFDITRRAAREHIAFGAGPHFCVGALVARQEMQKAFSLLLSRARNFERVGPRPKHLYSVLLRGLERLDIRFDPV